MNNTWFFYGIYMLWRWFKRNEVDPHDIEIVIKVKSSKAQSHLEGGICMEAHPGSAYPIDGLRVLHGELFREGFISTFMGMGLRFQKAWTQEEEHLRRLMRRGPAGPGNLRVDRFGNVVEYD